MSAKDLLFDFLNLIFLLLLVSFCIFFFIAGDRFAIFMAIMKSLVPLAIFGAFFLIKIKLNRNELKKRKEENNLEITLYLTFMDKFYTDAINYLLPAVIIIIPFLFAKALNITTIFQALLVFLIFYLWQRRLFKKI